jgi:DNA-directed RNA polymerase specialized sigma24 family protein
MMPVGPLKKSANDMLDMLRDPLRTRLDIVTLPEEMPVNEAVEIDHAAQHHRLCARGLSIINKVLPELPDDTQTAMARALTAATAENRERLLPLQEAIKALPDIYAKVVRMYDLEGRAVAEVASSLGRSEGAVYMLRARAHERLHEIMGRTSEFFSRSE